MKTIRTNLQLSYLTYKRETIIRDLKKMQSLKKERNVVQTVYRVPSKCIDDKYL